VPDQSIAVLRGNAFVVSNLRGDIEPSSRLPPHGFFSEDTRFVSRWHLTVFGRETDILSNAQIDYFSAQCFLVPPTNTFHGAPPLAIVRQRLVGDEWIEELRISNLLAEPAEVAIELEVGADFADLFDVKDERPDRRHVVAHTGERELLLRYRNGAFLRETRVTVSEAAEVEFDSMRLRLLLAPREDRTITFVVTPHSEQPGRPPTPRRTAGPFERMREQRRDELARWLSQSPRLATDSDPLRHLYHQSLEDLAALRFYPHLSDEDEALPAAGLPWFMTLFGRDSLITSYQAIAFRPELAATTLRTLASRQGTRYDDFKDEEPGKILHEIRFGELAATGIQPHAPYYGSADATPLFLILLDEYERWSGDSRLVAALEPNARAALAWIDEYGDLDGDGYVEYQTRNPRNGLVNQCWKDSWNSILFADGRLAGGPIATCEIQGYVYDAKQRAARLARKVWDDEALADRLLVQAADLRRRFQRDFWLEGRDCFALALDGGKRRVDSLTSNIGHLLWSGIVDEERAAPLVAHLMGPRLHSGWGVRTMADGEGGYNPVEYHNGTVWPHDNSLIAAGLRRYGFAAEAARIAASLVRAAPYFSYRLPEVFAGFTDAQTHAPVIYPTASAPQAWAAAAPLLALTTMLGLAPTPDGLRSDPHVPAELGQVALSGVPGRWGRADAGTSIPA
jgi:glycogen debranching enzyme